MISRAVTKYIRISPRKAMLVTRPLKGIPVSKVYALLNGINHKAAHFVRMTLRSAVDNARKKDRNIDEASLYISKITADGGPMLKRFRAGTMGRAFTILRRTCHLTIELSSLSKEQPKKDIRVAKKAVKTKAVTAETVKPKDTKLRTAKTTESPAMKTRLSNRASKPS